MERMKFIAALQEAGEAPFSEVCARFGISRQTGYKWKRRYEEGGAAALGSRPPIAHRHPNATSEEVEALVVELRKKRPTWGPKKLKAVLEREHGRRFPAASTIGDILTRRGLITRKKRRLRVPPQSTPTSPYTGPNSVWCIDHKGDVRLADGSRCKPLTLMDGFSRFLFRCEVVRSCQAAEARPHIESAFREYGLPNAIRSDGGAPFAGSRSPGRLSRLSVWWLKLGIELHRNEPASPQQNGRLERFHRTLKAETVAGGPYPEMVQERLFDAHRYDYNHVRPHEALDQRTPASAYVESWRSHPRVVEPPEYVGPDIKARRVQRKGHVMFLAHEVRVGQALAGESVCFVQRQEEDWDVYYARHDLLTFKLRRGEPRVVQRPPTEGDTTRRPPAVHFCA
ncbi:MAG: IS481 family transposase [Myxococcota bacterium]